MTTPPGGMIPYGRHCVEDDDIAALTAVLRSAWLTTGPKVAEFEAALSAFTGAREAVVFSSGTAALHAAAHALGIGPGDEVIVPPMTFAASANCVLYQGGTPVFADVDPSTLLLDPARVVERITPRTRAILAVDYAGQPCDYDALYTVAEKYGLVLIADACHSLGGSYRGRPVGSLARLTAFSFHPVKPITTAEGGAVTTDDPVLAQRMRLFRNHGITTDHRQREQSGTWFYEMIDLGYNYRLSDLQCALGLSQLPKLPGWIACRRAIAARYDDGFATLPGLRPLDVRADVGHAYHLCVVRLEGPDGGSARSRMYTALRAAGIGVNVHYPPVHLHPYYRQRLGTAPGLCPVAEAAYQRILSLPVFPGMDDRDVDTVIHTVQQVYQTCFAPADGDRRDRGSAA